MDRKESEAKPEDSISLSWKSVIKTKEDEKELERARKSIKKVYRAYKSKADAGAIDASKLRIEDIDSYNEEQILALERRFKEENFPKWRLYLLIPYNLLVGYAAYKYTTNFGAISKRFFRPRNKGLWDLLKYGTIQSTAFVALYLLGFCTVTGLWHPIRYARTLAKIQGKIVDMEIRFDDQAQEHFLFGFMKYFGLSDQIINTAKNELNSQRKDLEDRKYFIKVKPEDEDDDEDD
eukprot:TRINITY_DN2175_c0_g1_i2.p1 TRINITY_DN2175_c0_g1~~TRINITY_DN2175_c0_g1_i2.p1  ORF type:complete len:235 (-),score=60.71 TRINITY_DN2175_c0_g1_i2:111-815(-)